MKTMTYTIASPKLATPLVFDRVESGENVVKMFALRYLMGRFPGSFDMEDLDEFEVSVEELSEACIVCDGTGTLPSQYTADPCPYCNKEEA